MGRQGDLPPEKRQQWEVNQQRYRAAIKVLGITQAESAALLSKLSAGRPVSERAVRSWLNAIDAPSCSYCPEWAVELLEKQAQRRRAAQ